MISTSNVNVSPARRVEIHPDNLLVGVDNLALAAVLGLKVRPSSGVWPPKHLSELLGFELLNILVARLAVGPSPAGSSGFPSPQPLTRSVPPPSLDNLFVTNFDRQRRVLSVGLGLGEARFFGDGFSGR